MPIQMRNSRLVLPAFPQVAPVARRPVLAPSDATTVEAGDERSYFARVYRTAIPVGAVGAAVALAGSGLPGLIGFAVGAAVALASLCSAQLMVRHVVRPGGSMMLERLVLLQMLKLPLLVGVLTGVVWLVMHQIASAFTVVAGVALVPGVMFWKAIESWLAAALPASTASTDPAPRGSERLQPGRVSR